MSGQPTAPPIPPPGSPAPRERKRRWPKVLLIIGIVLAVLLALAAAGLFVLMQKVGQITVIGVPGTEAARMSDEPVNILLMGTDDRTGKGNRGYGRDSGRTTTRSDTTILLHISADRSRALALSIPRDLWTKQPTCTGAEWAGGYAKFNNAFEQGGAACTKQLVEDITDVPINHVIVVDFNGFKQDGRRHGRRRGVPGEPRRRRRIQAAATGGIDRERRAGLGVRPSPQVAGRRVGHRAHPAAAGFPSAAIRKATDTQLLLNPARVYEMIDVATRSLTVSSGLDGLSPMPDADRQCPRRQTRRRHLRHAAVHLSQRSGQRRHRFRRSDPDPGRHPQRHP